MTSKIDPPAVRVKYKFIIIIHIVLIAKPKNSPLGFSFQGLFSLADALSGGIRKVDGN